VVVNEWVGRRLAVQYFVVQAIAIAAWWIGLATIPSAWSWFAPASAPRGTLAAFAPSDIGVVIASALVAWGHRRPWAVPLAWIIAGAMTYAAIYTVAAVIVGLATLLSAILMIPVAIASITAAAALTRDASANAVSRRAVS